MMATGDMTSAVGNFLAFFWYSILGSLCIGLIAAAGAYLVRPLLGRVSQFWTIRRWANKRLEKARHHATFIPGWLAEALKESGHSDELTTAVKAMRSPPKEGASADALASVAEARFWSSALPDELFMHSMQVVAKAAVARPSYHPGLFEILTADAPPDARGAACAFSVLSERAPAEAVRLADFERPNNPTAAGLGSAENLIAASVEQALDQLQLDLLKKRMWTSRIFCVGAGVGLAVGAAWTLKSPSPAIFYAIGVAGGVAALVIDDAVAWLFGRAK